MKKSRKKNDKGKNVLERKFWGHLDEDTSWEATSSIQVGDTTLYGENMEFPMHGWCLVLLCLLLTFATEFPIFSSIDHSMWWRLPKGEKGVRRKTSPTTFRTLHSEPWIVVGG